MFCTVFILVVLVVSINVLNNISVLTRVKKSWSMFAYTASEDTACYQSVAAAKGFTTEIMGQVVGNKPMTTPSTMNSMSLEQMMSASSTAVHSVTAPAMSPYDSGPQGIKFAEAWEPLFEDNGSGYQHHVTPHIGRKAKFATRPEDGRTNRFARAPTSSS